MKRRLGFVALSIALAIPLLGFGVPGSALVPAASPTTTLTLISGGGSGGFGTPDLITTYAIVGGGSGQALIASPHPAWSVIPGTRWVNTSGVATPGSTDQALNKTTNYMVSFNLPDCFASPAVTIQVLADNAATLFLNGTQVGQQPQSALPANFQAISTFTWSGASDFRSGANSLTIANVDYGAVNGVDFQAVVTYSGFKFKGFFPPIENPGPGPQVVFNKVKAGSAVPVKFSLCANQGSNVIAEDYPRSEKVSCDAGTPLGDDKPTITPGNSHLVVDARTGRYHYVWQTSKAWGDTCRKLTVRLTDGTDHVAYFDFFR